MVFKEIWKKLNHIKYAHSTEETERFIELVNQLKALDLATNDFEKLFLLYNEEFEDVSGLDHLFHYLIEANDDFVIDALINTTAQMLQQAPKWSYIFYKEFLFYDTSRLLLSSKIKRLTTERRELVLMALQKIHQAESMPIEVKERAKLYIAEILENITD